MHTTEKAEIRRIQNVIAVANEAMVCVKDLYSQHPYTHMHTTLIDGLFTNDQAHQ